MKTEFIKIDKSPRCLKCGRDAEYELYRNGTFYRYKCVLCWDCLKEHLLKLNIFLNRDKIKLMKGGE